MSLGILSALKKEFGSVFGNVAAFPAFSASSLITIHSTCTPGLTRWMNYVSCDSNTTPSFATKFEGYEYCPRIRTFQEIFSPRNVSFILTKNIVISLALDITPHISHVCQELQDADFEDREPEMPKIPALVPSLKRGIWGSLRQATVTYLRWIFDRCVAARCTAAIAFKLLKDYRREITRVLTTCPNRLHLILPVYIITMEANYTWILADFSVSLLYTTYRVTKQKDKSRWMEYWLTNICFQAMKNVFQCLLSPMGAVIGTVVAKSVRGALVGYNVAELMLNGTVEYIAVSYNSR